MTRTTLNSLASVGLLAASSACFAQTLPSNAELAKEATKAMPRSADILKRAGDQTANQMGRMPDVGQVKPTGVAPAAADPSAVAKLYASAAAARKPQLHIAVSLSMPSEALHKLADQAAATGSHLVLRGVVDNSLPRTAELTAAYVKRHPGLQFDINPLVFRRFAITRVPTYVITKDDRELKQCSKECEASDFFVSVSGDVSLDYAMEHISKNAPKTFSVKAEEVLASLGRVR